MGKKQGKGKVLQAQHCGTGWGGGALKLGSSGTSAF